MTSVGAVQLPREQARWRWSHYLADGSLLAGFMISACVVTALVEHPDSSFRALLVSVGLGADWTRRAMVGLGMGLTALALIHSPWGKRSGAHMNPAVTLAYLRLGKVSLAQALGYITAQFLGGVAGVLLCALLMGDWLSHPSVAFVVTIPAPGSVARAFVYEVVMSAGLFGGVLWFTNTPRLARWTAVLCALLLTLYITFEAPVSGMSINPARSFGSALVAGRFDDYWVYFLAPPLGMVCAAELRVSLSRRETACPKLLHGQPCMFCQARASRSAPAISPDY